MHRFLRLGLSLVPLLLATSLPAQLAPVGAPKGSLRFDIRGAFESADRRLLDDQTEDYLADFGSSAFGSDRLPFLRATDSLVGTVLGQAGYRLNLGAQRANGQLTIGTGTIAAALGITSKVTLFANVPFVTTRVQARLRLDSTAADGGLNPAHPTLGNASDQALAATFFTAFDNALSTLQSRIQSGTYAGDPTLQAIALEIAARGTTARDALSTITRDPNQASPFLPTAASPTGQQIVASIRGLQDTLANTLGVPGFASDPVLAAGRLTDQEFAGFVSDPAGPMDAFPLGESKISRMGDMDVGAVLTLVDRFDRPGHTGGFRFAVTGLVRLPTGQRDNPANLLDVGTGNGRYEVGVSGTADLGAGRLGARFTGGYLLRLSTLRVRRLTAPGAPYALAGTLTNVREDAGDVMQLGARPFFRLARNIAIHGEVDFQRTLADAVSYDSPSDSIAGLSANLLAEKRRSALAVGGGVSYVGRSAHECEPGRRCGWPIEAGWSYTTVVQGWGGRVVKFRTTRLEIRWYQRIWR
ncbi:MAG TPA: hypothetical protein VH879_11840 [Gemmatimonadales bacterium]